MPVVDWKDYAPLRPDRPSLRECLDAFLHRSSPNALRGQQLTLNQFANLCGKATPDTDVIELAKLLVASNVLDVFYLFEGDDGRLEFVSAAEAAEAEQSGALVHPRTGLLVTKFQNRLFPVLMLRQAA